MIAEIECLTQETSMNETLKTIIPPIDASAPALVETATFALG